MWYDDKLKLVLPFLVMKYDKPHWNKLKSTGMVIFIYKKREKILEDQIQRMAKNCDRPIKIYLLTK